MCNCEFCIVCDNCGHKTDEHMAGEGQCYMKGCECTQHDSWVIRAWEQIPMAEQATVSFKDFADAQIAWATEHLTELPYPNQKIIP